MNQFAKIEPGVYINVFPVRVTEDPVDLLVTNRSNYPDLRSLRRELSSVENVWVYADEEKLYGYGSNRKILLEKGFGEIKTSLYDLPRLTARIIAESFFDKLSELKYSVVREKIKTTVFNFNRPYKTQDGKVYVYRGIEVRSIYLFDQAEQKLCFGLVVDIAYTFQDSKGTTLTVSAIRQNYGAQTLSEVRQIQGDLIPTGINTEASRERLVSQILPIVQYRDLTDFPLRVGTVACLTADPVRVVVGGKIV